METSEGYATSADGVRLYFMKIGDGPPKLALPNGFHLLDDFRALARHRTIVCYDVRNRGRSDTVSEDAKLERGVLNDVDGP